MTVLAIKKAGGMAYSRSEKSGSARLVGAKRAPSTGSVLGAEGSSAELGKCGDGWPSSPRVSVVVEHLAALAQGHAVGASGIGGDVGKAGLGGGGAGDDARLDHRRRLASLGSCADTGRGRGKGETGREGGRLDHGSLDRRGAASDGS